MKIIAETQAHITLISGKPIRSPCTEIGYRKLAFHFSIAPSLPPGLSLDSSTGAICGTPTACSSPRVFTLICRGADGATVSKGVLLEVVESNPDSDHDDDFSAANTLSAPNEDPDPPPRRCSSDPAGCHKQLILAPHTPLAAKQAARVAPRSPPRSRSPSPSRSGADAAVLVPLGPRLALALCDGDEARRVLRGRRMGRAAFIAASAALEGPVRLLPASPHAVLAIT